MAAGDGSIGRHWHCKRLSVLYFPFSETTPTSLSGYCSRRPRRDACFSKWYFVWYCLVISM
jgi:hypothetical protein